MTHIYNMRQKDTMAVSRWSPFTDERMIGVSRGNRAAVCQQADESL